MKYQFHFARRILSHVGVIQTRKCASRSEARRKRAAMKESGWAVWEITKIDDE